VRRHEHEVKEIKWSRDNILGSIPLLGPPSKLMAAWPGSDIRDLSNERETRKGWGLIPFSWLIMLIRVNSTKQGDSSRGIYKNVSSVNQSSGQVRKLGIYGKRKQCNVTRTLIRTHGAIVTSPGTWQERDLRAANFDTSQRQLKTAYKYPITTITFTAIYKCVTLTQDENFSLLL
jgi:hypothetical protein